MPYKEKSKPLTIFPAEWSLEYIAIYILRPLPKNRKGFLFILVIANRFTNLPQSTPLRRITGYDVAITYTEHCVFKYGPPKPLLSYNRPKFVAHVLQKVRQVLRVNNIFTMTNHPHCNVQVERLNGTITSMLRCYVD